jgi:hypothetical protein
MQFRKRVQICFLVLPLALFALQCGAFAQNADGASVSTAAEQLFALANNARAEQGAAPLRWDPALAAAALRHCYRMAKEGPIAHRYGGEADLAQRASQAGAHFGLIEENVAIGPTASVIQGEWMRSPGHRSNLLNPAIDHVGIAVVASRGVLYAVADYSREVQQLRASEVEARVAGLIRPSGVSVAPDHAVARAACATDTGYPRSANPPPGFIMRWQDAELTQLPQALVDHLATGRYSRAAVGSCGAQEQGSFSAYRVAVLLY